MALNYLTPDGAKKLLTEAGYPNGFEVGMDCPNDRYVNDEQICQAVVSMLAKIGVTVNLNAQPKAKYFAKILVSGNDTDASMPDAPGPASRESPACCRDSSVPSRFRSRLLAG